MGRILDHWNARTVAERHDRIHVGGMASHVADHHGLHIAQFGGEIGHVDAVILGHFAQDRHAIGMHD